MVSVTRLGDRYTVLSEIATGGMGTIYRARDERLHRTVAIKILKHHLAGDERFVERFRREARAVASLNHPNIASLYDYGQDDDRHFIVMECVEGRDLAGVLRTEGSLDPVRATNITQQICDALTVAHRAGIVHRDIKPANVLLGDDGHTKVTDFGIARAEGDSTLTVTGSILGTAHYLAPEQAAGHTATPATDIYATGIVLFEMLTGKVPFTGDSPVVVATRHVNDEMPSPRAVNPDVPPALADVVRTATQKDPKKRFADAASMSRALQDATSGETTEEISAPIAETVPLSVPARLRRVRSGIPPVMAFFLRRGIAVVVIAALTAIALALLAFRLVEDAPEKRTSAAKNRPSQDKPVQPEPAFVTVPDLRGWDLEDAILELQERGFVVSVAGEDEGRVVGDMSPGPGAEVEDGTTVTLSVAEEEEGREEENGDDKGEGGPPDHAEGHGKDKEKKDKE